MEISSSDSTDSKAPKKALFVETSSSKKRKRKRRKSSPHVTNTPLGLTTVDQAPSEVLNEQASQAIDSSFADESKDAVVNSKSNVYDINGKPKVEAPAGHLHKKRKQLGKRRRRA